jgi:anthranilate phosphoribosyltransferase
VPEDAGLPRASLADIQGGDPSENAAALTRLLNGETGAYRNIVLLNAAAGLMVAGKAADLTAGVALAEAAIDDGRARALLKNLADDLTDTDL